MSRHCAIGATGAAESWTTRSCTVQTAKYCAKSPREAGCGQPILLCIRTHESMGRWNRRRLASDLGNRILILAVPPRRDRRCWIFQPGEVLLNTAICIYRPQTPSFEREPLKERLKKSPRRPPRQPHKSTPRRNQSIIQLMYTMHTTEQNTPRTEKKDNYSY